MTGFFRWRPHPWHGISPGPDVPRVVHAYIEITPFDAMKYEVDKETGYLRVDRPQRYSSQPPTLYGFIPQTYCGERVRALTPGAERGDGDPMDICVLSERPISRAEVLLNARVVGGMRIVDHGEADDKIVAVLENDDVFGGARALEDLPGATVERLRHYFTTYKQKPGADTPTIQWAGSYGAEDAQRVIEAALEDYAETFARVSP